MRLLGTCVSVLCIALFAGAARADEHKLTDSTFVDKTVSGNTVEIALGEIGQARATNADVKKFAARVVKDHTKVKMDLLYIVSDLKIAVPEKPLPDHEKKLVHFGGNQVKDFDKEFMKHMVESHEAGVKLFTQASKELKNDRLKEFASKTLPTLKEHLEMAKKINDQVSSSKTGTR